MNQAQSFCRSIKRTCTIAAPVLPAEYQQVKYIQSYGNQYFNIDWLYYHAYFDLTFEFVSFVNNEYARLYNLNGLLGANGIYSGGETGIQIDTKVWITGNNVLSIIVSNTTMATPAITANTKYNLYISPSEVKLNGVTISTTTAEYIAGGYPWGKCGVFGCYGKNNIQPYNACSAKLYRLKSAYVDLYPCYRKSDNKPGMYDINHDVFYTNLGTGEFTVGNNV